MQIIKSASLVNYNTFHLNVQAEKLLLIDREEDYKDLFHHILYGEDKILVVGAGSNLLFTDNFDGTVISIRDQSILMIKDDHKNSWLKIGAGMSWHQLVLSTIDMGLQGLENLSLIPGKAGAAPIQNIGAYGVEIEQFIEQVEAVDLIEQKRVEFTHKECQFGYRSSVFKSKYKGRYLITSIILRLNKIPDFNTSYEKIQDTLRAMKVTSLSAKAISQAVIAIRKEKLPDPDLLGNAGSFFKNPVVDEIVYTGLKAEYPGIIGFKTGQDRIKLSAAWLIEQSGWKSRRLGDAGVYRKQPLVLINYGRATGKEILEFATDIRDSVEKKFGIKLEAEVNII